MARRPSAGPAGTLLLATLVVAGAWFLVSARRAFTLPPGTPTP
jgi:hypothetical protein